MGERRVAASAISHRNSPRVAAATIIGPALDTTSLAFTLQPYAHARFDRQQNAADQLTANPSALERGFASANVTYSECSSS